MTFLKKSLLVILLLLLSGCSVEYNLTINKDLTINENVLASENENVLITMTGLDTKESINTLYNKFKRDNLDTKLSSSINNSKVKATVRGKHKSIDDYVSNFTSDIYNEAIITREDSLVTLTFDQSIPLKSTGRNVLIYDDLKINISLPFKVKKHNADSVRGNTYTWNLDRDNATKNILISYDEKEYVDSFSLNLFNNTFNINYSLITIGIIGFVVLVIVIVVFINNKKNNKV